MFPIRFLPILFGLLSPFAHAEAPSGETWFTLKTPHFRVHHTAPLEAYARHFAFSLERALPKLEATLKWKAPTPIDIVLADTSDSANGLAVSFPNTHIEIYATPFEQDSTLAYYSDWVNELATHELTHIVANDTALGYYLTLRSIFGSWVKPNGLQPVWLSEGLAVYQETSLTPAGRGRSPWVDAMLREAVRSGKLDSSSYSSLDRFNDGNEWWPGGALPYLMGYSIQALASEKNHDLPGELSHNNGRLLPFLPNYNLENVSGRDWADVWSNATAKLKTRYGNSIESPAQECFLSSSGQQTGGQALSSDGWIYFSEQDFHHGTHLSRVRADAPCTSKNTERLYFKRYGGPTQVAVSEDGKTVAFSAFQLQRFERMYSDIYIWHRDRDHTEQLTHNDRARDPAFSGPYLFYIFQKADMSQGIRRRHLSTGEETEIFAAPPLDRISSLSARGTTLVFGWHNNQGQEKIFRLSTEGGKPEALIAGKKALRIHERSPYIASDNSVWFAGTTDAGVQDRANTQSIYRFKDNKVELMHSASSGFADRPIPSGDALLLQQYHLSGMDIARVPLEAKPSPAIAPAEDLHAFLTGQAEPEAYYPTSQDLSSVGDIVPYSAVSTPATSMWPQYWLPELAAAEEGVLLGVSTSGNDPLEYHRYGGLIQYDSRSTFPLYHAFYRNRTWPTNFLFEANQTNTYFASSQTSHRTNSYSAEAIVPIGQAFYAIGGAFQKRVLFGAKSQAVIVYQNLSYNRTGKTPSAIDPNFGQELKTYVAVFPNAPSEKLFADIRPLAGLYFGGLSDSHSVSLVARAGITTNRLLASNYYLGGGLSVLDTSDYVVRGYPLDTLLGQRIATANFAYSLPLARPYRGLGMYPAFLESIGLRFLADAGSASYLATYNGNVFQRYVQSKLTQQVLTGFGVDMVGKGSIFYHVPLDLVAGVHYGTRQEYGGGYMLFLGMNVGLNTNFGSQEIRREKD